MEMVSGFRPDDDGDSMRLSMRVTYGDWFAAVERPSGVFMLLLAGTLVFGAIMAPFSLRSAAAQAPANKPIKLVVLGDSLTAGYGLPADAAFPVRLQKALKDKGIEVEMSNAGV